MLVDIIIKKLAQSIAFMFLACRALATRIRARKILRKFYHKVERTKTAERKDETGKMRKGLFVVKIDLNNNYKFAPVAMPLPCIPVLWKYM